MLFHADIFDLFSPTCVGSDCQRKLRTKYLAASEMRRFKLFVTRPHEILAYVLHGRKKSENYQHVSICRLELFFSSPWHVLKHRNPQKRPVFTPCKILSLVCRLHLPVV